MPSLSSTQIAFAQEAILFAERSDITEELTRLEAHLQACTHLLSSAEAVGRKIEFLVQEMHREVNTIGSKSNDTAIAHSVVELKASSSVCASRARTSSKVKLCISRRFLLGSLPMWLATVLWPHIL